MEKKGFQIKTSLILFIGIAVAILLVIADYFSGPFVQFPISYLIPIALLSWNNGRYWGLALAIVMPLIRFYYNVGPWTVPWTITEASINAVIRILVLSSFALLTDRTATQTRRLSRQVFLLEGLLPICAYCKKIRDQNGKWQVIEKYITDRSTAKFTHGICPECQQEQFGDILTKQA